jgi:outer membrane protein assembly factor BamB
MTRLGPLLALSVAGFAATPLLAADWPQWRGPDLRGTSPETGLPVKWSASEGLAWKLALPTGSGSTPIVSGDRIFVNVAEGDVVSLWCLDRKTSAALWRKPLGASAGHAHRKHNMSTPSPVTDGKRVFAAGLGRGLGLGRKLGNHYPACYKHDTCN